MCTRGLRNRPKGGPRPGGCGSLPHHPPTRAPPPATWAAPCARRGGQRPSPRRGLMAPPLPFRSAPGPLQWLRPGAGSRGTLPRGWHASPRGGGQAGPWLEASPGHSEARTEPGPSPLSAAQAVWRGGWRDRKSGLEPRPVGSVDRASACSPRGPGFDAGSSPARALLWGRAGGSLSASLPVSPSVPSLWNHCGDIRGGAELA